VARAVELGGRVTSAPETIRYGRIATITDPAGAELSLIARSG
jgi:predicted enzyme related to lactoylglutathione lyase